MPKNVIGDKQRMQQVALNLIFNAIDNTKKGHVFIYVNYDSKEQQLIFIVQDTGVGIAKEDQKSIFKMFYS